MNRPTLSYLGLALAAAALLAGCGDQAAPKTSTPTPKPAILTGGKLVYSDNFDDGKLGPDWVQGKGGEGRPGPWSVVDGMVQGVDIHNYPLWLQKELPDKVRVEWDVKSLGPVGDVKAEIFGDGVHHESGYILIYGGWKNTLDVMARLDEHGHDRKARTTRNVMPGHLYHMAAVRTGSTLKWYVDNKLFMTYPDAHPLTGKGHRHFAFSIWSQPVRYDNLKIYDLSK